MPHTALIPEQGTLRRIARTTRRPPRYAAWVRVTVKVKPSSGRREVVTEQDGTLVVYLKAAPENGKANAELIASLARHFHVTQSNISIIRGATSRSKVVDVRTL